MNQTIKELFERKSVRVFEDKEISAEDKQLIMEAACQAATAGNQQLYTIIDVTDQALKEALVETCDHQPMIAQAKMVLIFCADCQKWYDAYINVGCEPRLPAVGDLLLAVSDANIAAQNAVVAAQSLGIGSCYIGDVMENCEKQRKLLNLPEYVFPAAMLIFGYPTEQQQGRAKPVRSDLRYIVHENGYHRMSGEELQAMLEVKMPVKSAANSAANADAENSAMDYKAWLQAFCNRKYNSDFSKEMSRSVAEYLKAFMK